LGHVQWVATTKRSVKRDRSWRVSLILVRYLDCCSAEFRGGNLMNENLLSVRNVEWFTPGIRLTSSCNMARNYLDEFGR